MSDRRDDSALTKLLLAAWPGEHHLLEQYLLYFTPNTIEHSVQQSIAGQMGL